MVKHKTLSLAPFATNAVTSVVTVHGLNAGDGSAGTAAYGDNRMPNCSSYWQDTKNFLSSRWKGDLRQLGYYTNDCSHPGTGSSANLRDSIYSSHCSNFWDGNDGTNNENLGHVACELDWYLYYNFGVHNYQEIIVGHSMGGLIVRKALQLVANHDSAVPSNIGYVADAITLNAPLIGTGSTGPACGYCLQGIQMSPSNNFIGSMNNNTHIDVGGHTDWTSVSSNCDNLGSGDQLVSWSQAIALNQDHKVRYIYADNENGCDTHGGIVRDTDPNLDASTMYCDNYNLSNPDNCGTAQLANYFSGSGNIGNWLYDASQPHGANEIYYALSSSSW